MRAAILTATAIGLGALSGCRAGLDGLAQYTGTGTDPEGVVHAFLWALKDGRDTRTFWKDPVDGRPRAEHALAAQPMSWRALPSHDSDDGWRWFTSTTWKRFVVTSRLPDGRVAEQAWDFCLEAILEHGPRYVFLDVWRNTYMSVPCGASSSRDEK